MNTGHYIRPNEVMFMAAGFSGDIEFKAVPKGFYLTLIQDAFRELNLSSFFLDARHDYVIGKDRKFLLPDDCLDVVGVWVFNGDSCNIESSSKVYWKRNFYNVGSGYIANNKGQNDGDPYIVNTTGGAGYIETKRSYASDSIRGGLLYYEIENNELRISSSCTNTGAKIHIKYKSSGGKLEDVPVIPLMFKDAMTDYVTEGILRFRMANEMANLRNLSGLFQIYSQRLDKNGMNGSWHKAVVDARSLSKAKMEDLRTYLGKGAWATGR